MSRRLLCFVAILKDEAGNIRRTLESVRGVADQWVVLDTGSTDGTQDIVREVMSGIPGALYEEPFVDFATSRNRVLDLQSVLEEPAVFTLMLSGDERLEGDPRQYLEMKRDAEEGAYCVEVCSAGVRRWLYPRVLRADAKWRYVGDVHEIPEGPEHSRNGPTVPGVRVVHTATDPERKFKRMREFDLPRLQVRASNEAHGLEERAQAIWFLAQTHEALAEEDPSRSPGGNWITHKLSAMSLYMKRTEIGDDPLQSSYAWLCGLKIASELGFIYTPDELLLRLRAIIDMNPRLPEAHYMLALQEARTDARRGLFLAEQAARVAHEASEAIASQDQTFYLPTDTRIEWVALGLAADCARVLNNNAQAKKLAEQAVSVGGPPEKFAEFLRG